MVPARPVFLTVALLAFAVIGACGGESGSRPATPTPRGAPSNSATSAPTLMPIATSKPNPTVDPKELQISNVYGDILMAKTAIESTLADLSKIPRGGSLGPSLWASYQNRCVAVAVEYRRVESTTFTYWPKPYRDLIQAHLLSCGALLDEIKARGDPADVPSWQVEAILLSLPLQKAYDALPDYSDAQLRRAIAERF